VRIKIATVRPFKDRSEKIALRFDFDSTLIDDLKRILRDVRRAPGEPAGGWIKPLRAWFVEPSVWPEVRRRLEGLGCTFLGSESDVLPYTSECQRGPTLFEPETGPDSGGTAAPAENPETSGPLARCRAALEWLAEVAADLEGVLERGQVQGRPLDSAWLAAATGALQTAAQLLDIDRLAAKAWKKAP
jgi:hypothetical protein